MVVLVSFYVGIAQANFFAPNDPTECAQKYRTKVKFEDALPLVGVACTLGYGDDDFEPSLKKAGKCILSSANEIYSFESATKVINSCTKTTSEFNVFRNALYRRQSEIVEKEKNQRNEKLSQPYYIRDAATGNIRVCQKNGNLVECF